MKGDKQEYKLKWNNIIGFNKFYYRATTQKISCQWGM